MINYNDWKEKVKETLKFNTTSIYKSLYLELRIKNFNFVLIRESHLKKEYLR